MRIIAPLVIAGLWVLACDKRTDKTDGPSLHVTAKAPHELKWVVRTDFEAQEDKLACKTYSAAVGHAVFETKTLSYELPDGQVTAPLMCSGVVDCGWKLTYVSIEAEGGCIHMRSIGLHPLGTDSFQPIPDSLEFRCVRPNPKGCLECAENPHRDLLDFSFDASKKSSIKLAISIQTE